jgi:hypothetical protein
MEVDAIKGINKPISISQFQLDPVLICLFPHKSLFP